MSVKISPDWNTFCKIMGTEDPNDIQLELRETIVQEFTKRYLKGLVKTEEFEKHANLIRKEISTEFEKTIEKQVADIVETNTTWGTKKYALKQEIVDKINLVVENNISNFIKAKVEEKLSYIDLNDLVNKKVASLIDWKEAYIEQKIKENFIKMVTKTMNDITNVTNNN